MSYDNPNHGKIDADTWVVLDRIDDDDPIWVVICFGEALNRSQVKELNDFSPGGFVEGSCLASASVTKRNILALVEKPWVTKVQSPEDQGYRPVDFREM